jgi:hypothetical protein
LPSDEEEIADQDGDHNMKGTLVLKDAEIPSNTSVSPLAVQEKKRPRTSSHNVEGNDQTNARSVLSFEESGRAQ